MEFLSALVGMTMALTGSTTTQELLQGTSDAFSGNMDLQIVLDDSFNATGMQGTVNGETQSSPLTGLAQGIPLFTYDGKTAISVQSTNFDPAHGGVFDVTYLHNGITGSYNSITVDIEKTGSTWQMTTDDQTGRNVVTHGYFKAKKLFGKVIGIDSITLSP